MNWINEDKKWQIRLDKLFIKILAKLFESAYT